jgi:hypothetical protein
VPPIFSSKRIVPVGLRDAEVRADADLAEEARAVVGRQRALQVGVADRGAGADDLAVAQLELDAVDVDARGRRAHGEAHAAVGAVLLRPVKTSPLGMLRLPSELTHVRPATLERQVGALGLQAQLARVAQAGDQALLEGAQAAPRATGSGWSRNSAPRTKAAKSSSAMPACSASASVGHSVEHQRFFIVASRIGRPRPRVARDAIGVDAGQLARRRRAPGCRAARRSSWPPVSARSG